MVKSAAEQESAEKQFRGDANGSFVVSAMLGLGLFCFPFLFGGAIPQQRAWIWLGSCLSWLSIYSAILVIGRSKPRRAAEIRRFWLPLIQHGAKVSLLVALSFIWVWLPFTQPADDTLVILMTIFLITAGIFAGTHIYNFDGPMILMPLASVIAILLWKGGDNVWLMAVFLTAYGLGMLVMVRRMREAYRALDAARLEIEQERDAKLRLIASGWHDLGQPIRAARLLADFDGDKARETLKGALESSEAMLRNMIDFLRLESGTLKVEAVPVPLVLCLTRVASILEPAALRAGIMIDAMSTSMHVLADQALLERALSNLAENAITHSQASRLLIGARRRGRSARIWVIDNGVGIAEADLPRLFDDYYQSLTSNSDLRPGFGLGLASAKRIARLQGGMIGIDRRWKHGSAFFLDLPLA